ncbi:hypothetical protein Avbf_03819 [Armadillidium vulgare]|nr:hypothetical protein Avbf_03819 [Armadillidium vulgare]
MKRKSRKQWKEFVKKLVFNSNDNISIFLSFSYLFLLNF